MAYGTLAINKALHKDWPWHVPFGGVPPPTRPEEYDFVLRESEHFKQRENALDAACGWRTDWHIFGQNFVYHYQIPMIAMDLNPEHLYKFDKTPNIVRMLGDICGMPFADYSFDVVFCFSTIEHLPSTYCSRALYELSRVCNNTLILTFDGANFEDILPILEVYGFDAGDRINQPGETLVTEKCEPVSYIIAERVECPT